MNEVFCLYSLDRAGDVVPAMELVDTGVVDCLPPGLERERGEEELRVGRYVVDQTGWIDMDEDSDNGSGGEY